MKEQKKFNAKKLEPHEKLYNIKFDGVENVDADAAIIAAIQEAYASGAKIRMRLDKNILIAESTHDYLKKDSLIDVTNQAVSIIRELKKGRLSYPTRLILQENKEIQKEKRFLIFTIERTVRGMMDDIQILKSWMELGQKIWRIDITNSLGTLLLLVYVKDQKHFEDVLSYLERFMNQRPVYRHNSKIQFLHEEELVNLKVAKVFEAELEQSGFMPVKSAQVEYKKIKRLLKTATWVNLQEEEN